MSACRYSALMISTRCCVPTGRSSTSAVGIDGQAVLAGQLADPLRRRGDVEERALVGLGAEHDVLGHGEHRHQLEVLVDHPDAARDGVAGVAQVHRLALDDDLALVGRVEPEQHLHERALAGAVLAEQPVDLAPAQLDADVVVGDDRREALGEVTGLQHQRAASFIAAHSFSYGWPAAAGGRTLPANSASTRITRT